MKEIRFVIESNLENVGLVGMSINALCTHIAVSEINAYQIELCAVEAINNSIIHAYGNESGNLVETSFAFDDENIILEISDTGKSMDKDVLDRAVLFSSGTDESPDLIAESGRGLALIKEIMDSISYSTTDGRNCFTMTKTLSLKP